MKPAPSVKIEMIEGSLRCFRLGTLGLLPLIGLPFAFMALRHYRRVCQIQDGQWNPARRYLFWGRVCARIAIVLFGIELTLAAALYAIETRCPRDDWPDAMRLPISPQPRTSDGRGPWFFALREKT